MGSVDDLVEDYKVWYRTGILNALQFPGAQRDLTQPIVLYFIHDWNMDKFNMLLESIPPEELLVH